MKNKWDIEDAKKYFLVPLKDKQSLYLVGGKKRLMALEIVLNSKKVVATTGVNTETCYIMVDMNGKQVEKILDKMNKVMKDAK